MELLEPSGKVWYRPLDTVPCSRMCTFWSSFGRSQFTIVKCGEILRGFRAPENFLNKGVWFCTGVVPLIQSVLYSLHSLTSDSIKSVCTSKFTTYFRFITPTKRFHWFHHEGGSHIWWTFMTVIHQIWWTSIIHMSHSQMLGKFEYGLPAKFWRLVGCTEMLSW